MNVFKMQKRSNLYAVLTWNLSGLKTNGGGGANLKKERQMAAMGKNLNEIRWFFRADLNDGCMSVQILHWKLRASRGGG